MGSAASKHTPKSSVQSLSPVDVSRKASLRPTGLAKPIIALKKSESKSNVVRSNVVAPIIIKNCREEYQQIVDITEPIIYGCLEGANGQHPLLLNECCLVKEDIQCIDDDDTVTSYGAPNFRKGIDNFSVFCSGQPTCNGLETIVDFIKQQDYQWITILSLRKESVFFMKEDENMVPYTLRYVKDPCEVYVNPSKQDDPADDEMRIRKIVLDLATLNERNQFYIYNDIKNLANQPNLQRVQFEDDIQLLEEVFSRRAFKSPYIRYKRIPFPKLGPPTVRHFDMFLTMYKECPTYFTEPPESHAVLLTCQDGIVRSTVALVIACLIQHHVHGSLIPNANITNKSDTIELNPEDKKFLRGEFYSIMRLVNYMSQGVILKTQVDEIIDACSHLYNIRTIIYETKKLLEDTTSDFTIKEMPVHTHLRQKAVNYLDTYFMLIVFNGYLSQQSKSNFSLSFSKWLRWHPGIMRIRSQLDVTALTAPVDLVLQGSRKLVADDYIGLDLLSSQMDVKVSNFRRVPGFPVYGMAQPNQQGLQKVVNHLLTKKSSHPYILHVNLRNDMCLECNGTTYHVCEAHDLELPLDLVGISQQNIEVREEELKHVLLENVQHIQLYDDIDEEPAVRELTTVCSPIDLSIHQKHHTQQYMYSRCPMDADMVFDEEVFDRLLNLLNATPDISANENSPAILFSCRTGRSRTTTALTVASLIVCHKSGFPYGSKAGEQERVSLPNAKYTKGDYLIVQSLVRVLPDGQQVKREVDFILDKCFETMTPMHFHLREVIFVTYNKIKSARSQKEEQRWKILSLAYLERYLYLILFNAYLHAEKESGWSQLTFSQWMTCVAARAGVYDILDNLYFSDFETEASEFQTMISRWSTYTQPTTECGEFV